MLKLSGYWLIVTSVLHVLGGFVFFPEPLAAIAQSGWLNAVSPNPFHLNFEREAAFWFMMAAPLWFLLGLLCCWAQAQQIALPALVGWILLIITLVSVLIMPASGLWLLIPPSLMIVAVAARNPRTTSYQ